MTAEAIGPGEFGAEEVGPEAFGPGEVEPGEFGAEPPAVALPELAVPPHVLVVSLTAAPEGPPRPARIRRLTQEWLALEPALGRHRHELAGLLEVACGQARLGEVAAFLDYRDDQAEGRLIGGAAILSLELVDQIAGSTGHRAEVMAQHLRRAAAGPSTAAGFCAVTTRRTASGAPATWIQFVAAVPDAAAVAGAAAVLSGGAAVLGGDGGPVVEVCRWLYPVPARDDLVWALAFQTTDLDRADQLVAEFDQMATSLTWVDGDD